MQTRSGLIISKTEDLYQVKNPVSTPTTKSNAKLSLALMHRRKLYRPTTVPQQSKRATISSLLKNANQKTNNRILSLKTQTTRRFLQTHNEVLKQVLNRKQFNKKHSQNMKSKPPLARKPPIPKFQHPKEVQKTLQSKKPQPQKKQTPKILRYNGIRTPTSASLLSSVSFPNCKIMALQQDYIFGRVIGQGAYAIVRQSVHKLTNQKVAIKTYEKYRLIDPSKRKAVNRQMKILQTIDHPNVVKLHGVIDTSKQLHLILQYLPGKSLHSYLKDRTDRKLSEIQAKPIFKQVLQAVGYCHSQNVAHRDIKLENLLIDDQKSIRLIDFGFSTCFPPGRKMKMFCGTPTYMAPQIVSRKEFDGHPADVWALGVLLYALVVGSFPFKGANDRELYRKIQRGYVSYPKEISVSVRAFISSILIVDPNKRPTVKSLLNDAWVCSSGIFRTVDTPVQQTTIETPSQAVDLNIVSSIKKLGYSQDQIMKDLQCQKSQIALLYKKIKRSQNSQTKMWGSCEGFQ